MVPPALRSRAASLALFAIVASTLLAGCGGGNSTPATVPDLTSAKAIRDMVNDAPGLTSTVQVKFDRSFDPTKTLLPLASLFEIEAPDPFSGKSSTRRILAQSAEIDKTSDRTVLLHIKELVPSGSTLKVAKKGFVKDADGDLTVNVDGDLSPLDVLLASKALALSDPSVVDDSVELPATDADRDPAAVRKTLEQALNDRGASDATRQKALDRYDSIPADVVPAPKARAALAFLTGTFAEAAIDNDLTTNNCTGKVASTIAFHTPEASQLLAQVTFTSDGRRVISLSPSIEGERIEHIAPILAHESIHCDAASGKFEEVAATAMDTFLYLVFAIANPDIVHDGTRLTKEQNIDAIAMINSGRLQPESVGILPSPGVTQAIPDTNSQAASFADLVAAAYQGLPNDTPDEPLAVSYVSALASIVGVQPQSPFNLLYLDGLLGSILPSQALLNAIQALGLVPA
jgi:hypothetical protein